MAKREPKPEEPSPGLPRLPPGRHGLPRSFVTQNQRDRLTAGMIATVVQHGYHEATITQIAAAAGVSRRTFYGYFSSKQECFFDTFGQIDAHLTAAVRAAADGEGDWPQRVRAQLAALLEVFAANPDLARFCLVAAPNAGGEIAARGRALLEHLLAILTEDCPPDAHRPSAAIQAGLIGGIAALIVRQVKVGEGETLTDLLPDLLELVLAPYLGRQQALRIARS